MNEQTTIRTRNTKQEFICPVCNIKFLNWASQNPITCGKICSIKLQQINAVSRFWERVEKTDNCWLWMGKRSKRKYGRMRLFGKEYFTHKYSFEAFYSLVPDGLYVLHSCDNPPCCNPEHLWLGTVPDNNKDMRDKRRHSFGDRHGQSVLTNEDVLSIKKLHSEGMSRKEIWSFFSDRTTLSNIGRIIRKDRWSLVELPTPQPQVSGIDC